MALVLEIKNELAGLPRPNTTTSAYITTRPDKNKSASQSLTVLPVHGHRADVTNDETISNNVIARLNNVKPGSQKAI